VAFYVIYTISKVSKTLCKVNLKEIAQKVFKVGAEMRRKSNLQQKPNITPYAFTQAYTNRKQ